MTEKRQIDMLLRLLLGRLGRVGLCETPRTAARQAPLSMGFSRQEYWSGLPSPHSEDFLDPIRGFWVAQRLRESACNAGDAGIMGRFLGLEDTLAGYNP